MSVAQAAGTDWSATLANMQGACLQQGLVLCGRCGRSMKIRHSKIEGQARFCCNRAREQSGAAVCQSFGSRRLERAVEELLSASLAPLGMEAIVKDLPEDQKETVIAQIARSTRRAIARTQGQQQQKPEGVGV